ncbi:hypothetical protein EUTSA_v10029162mg, partial [Eutrema salsugineum]
ENVVFIDIREILQNPDKLKLDTVNHSVAMMSDERNKCKERSSPEPQTQPPSPKHDPDMVSSSSAASFRFSPTYEELVLHYLKPFLKSKATIWPVHHVNIYESNPKQLSAGYKKGNLTEWFFVSERTNMHKGGKKQNRGDNGGYWHVTGAATKFNAGNGIFGNKASLVYYTRRKPNGVKTNWLMKEYWLEPCSDDNLRSQTIFMIYWIMMLRVFLLLHRMTGL